MHLLFKTRQTLLRGGLLCNTSLFIKCTLISHPGKWVILNSELID